MRALNNNATDNYWFESGTSASLIEHLKHFPNFNPLDFDGVELALEDFNVPCEKASTPVPMLYQSGYLTIDYYNNQWSSSRSDKASGQALMLFHRVR